MCWIFYVFEPLYDESMHCFDDSEGQFEQDVGLKDQNEDDIDNISDRRDLPRSRSAFTFVREQLDDWLRLVCCSPRPRCRSLTLTNNFSFLP